MKGIQKCDTEGTVYFQEQFPDPDREGQQQDIHMVITTHLFLAKEGSPAGNIWNDLTINYLKKVCQTAKTGKKLSAYDLLLKKTSEVLNTHCRAPGNVKIEWHKDNCLEALEKSEVAPLSQAAPTTSRSRPDWNDTQPLEPRLRPAHFSLTATGNLELKAGLVYYEGFRMRLVDGQFLPQVLSLLNLNCIFFCAVVLIIYFLLY
jgi:hypothetical protein